MENNSFGIIVAYKLGDFDLNNEKMLQAFAEAGIPEDFRPKERGARKAFKKALDDAIEGDEDLIIRKVGKHGSMAMCGLVQEKKSTSEKDLKYNVCNVITLNTESSTIQGKSDFRTTAIADSYKGYKGQLGGMEVATNLKELLFVSMGVTVMCGNATFIPSRYKSNVDKIVKLFELLQKHECPVKIEVMGVDRGTETRNNIIQQFSDQILKVIQKDIDKCVKLTQDLQNGDVAFSKPTAMARLQHKFDALNTRVRLYVRELELTPEEDKPILDKLEELDVEMSKAMDEAAKHKPVKKSRAKLQIPIPKV